MFITFYGYEISMTRKIMTFVMTSLLVLGLFTMQQSNAEEDIEFGGIGYEFGTSEVLRVPFYTTAISTTEKYDGLLLVSVSGSGQSLATAQNDAFYVFTNTSGEEIVPYNDSRFYQLSASGESLFDWNVGLPSVGSEIKNSIVFDVDADMAVEGSYIPEFQEDHEYNFVVDLGSESEFLNFGVSDGRFGDNSGVYDITIVQLVLDD